MTGHGPDRWDIGLFEVWVSRQLLHSSALHGRHG